MVEGGKLVFLCQLRMEPQGLVADEPTTNSSAQDYRFTPARYTHPFHTLGPTERKPQEKCPGRTKKKLRSVPHCHCQFFFLFFFCTFVHVITSFLSSRLCIFWVYRIKTKQINVVWAVCFWFVAVSISHASTPTKISPPLKPHFACCLPLHLTAKG